MKRRALSFIVTLALCLNLCPVWVLAADEGTSEGLCTHHPAHTEECGYVSDEPGAPCTFVCPICPIEERIGKLPASVSADNREQVQAQLSEIFDLYEELTSDEQQLVDISPCASLLDQLDGLEAEVLEPEVLEPEALESEVLETEVLEAEVQSEASSDNNPPLVLDGNQSFDTPFEVSFPYTIDTNGHTITGTGSAAILVTASGDLNLRGTVVSTKGAGVEVSGSGSLRIAEQAEISGQTYALDIASGAAVYLSAGKYTGKVAAIHMESGNFASLLASGCAYFDESGAPIPPADVEEARTVIVKQCTDHSSKYTPNAGSPTHAWTCEYCGTGVKKEKCTFEFNGNTSASCGEQCGHSIDITVDESALGDLIYNGADQTANVTLTVKLEDGTALTKDTDYTVNCSARTDVGDITVTVTGLTFNGTFVKTYHINPDQPGIKWDAAEKELEYDGRRTTIKDELPNITITIKAPNNEDLHPYLQYSYKKTGDTEFTDGLPLDVGEYEIKAYLRKSQNYEAAETYPLLKLTIKAIDPVTDAPEAAKPTYNGSPQALVTAGTVDSRATGAEILFATSENGEYSAAIPTATNAGDYEVWYKVEGTGNYHAVGPIKIDDVKILRKPITPFVTLSDYTYQYDGGDKQPKVTVKDDDNVTVLLDTEYQVVYKDNRDVGTATVEVSDKPLGNYAIETVEVPFQITAKTQEALSITGQRDTVTYGDKFVLGTSGGSGNGVITWEITSGSDVAKVDENSGQITIIGHGQATVQATKSGKDPATNVTNYEDATASWIFTADQKPVVATVTAEDKTYNGDKVATVQAVVEQGVLAGDEITITGLTGTFGDENAGADKIVTVDTSNPTIGGTNYEHYDVSFSGTTVKATIHKAVVHITTPPNAANLTYDGTAQELIDASVLAVDTAGVLVEYALSEDGPYSTAIPKGTDAGTYTVWYRVQETNNYTGQAPAKVDVTIAQKQVTPAITLSGDGLTVEADGSYSYIYDGNAKEPVVTLYEADGTTVIPTGEYTVSYSNNTNVGNATVTVTAKAGGNYSFTPVTKIFTISKEKAQVLTAPEAAGEPLYYNTFAQKLVTAGTGSGGTMVYSKDNATFTDQIPTETNAGDYTVHYKVKGDSNHSDSDVGSVTVTIAPKTVKDPTIELLDDNGAALVSYTYDGNAKEPTVVVKDGSTPINADEYNIIYSDNVDAGRATVSITDKPGGNYTVTGSTTFVILKADIVFTQDPADAGRVYNGKPQELLNPGVSSGGTVMYALGSATSTYTDAIPTATEAGTYTVYYKVVGDKNHNDFAAQSVFGTIQRKQLTAITIELDPISFVYDGTVKMPEVTVKDGGAVLPKEEYTQTCSDPAPKDQGTYTITITGAADGNYDLAGVTANTATFTIGKTAQAELVIEGKPDSTIYGDTFQLTTSGGSSASAVTWEASGPATIDGNGNVVITGVGEVTIMATNPGDQNYIPVQAQWTFTAAPKAVTASIVVADRDYDGTTDATVSSASISVLNGDTVTITPASITAEFDTASVGTGKTVTLDTSNVQVSGADAAKYDISYPDTIKGSITPKNVTVTVTLSDHDLQPDANGWFYTYDGTEKKPAVTVTGTDGDYSDILTSSDYTVSYSGNKNAGTAAVTIKNAAGGNYTFADETVHFEIRNSAAVLTSTPQAKDLTYNGTAQDLVTVGTATGGTVLYSDTGAADSYSETIPQGKNAVTYTVYYMVKGDANHTDTAPGQVSVTIKPKEITPAITLSQASYGYDGNAKTPGVTVKDGTDTIDPGEYTVSYRDNTNAGTATVIVSNNNGGNYIVNGTASFEITKAAPTFTAPTGKNGLQYNGELQELVAAGICSEGTVVYSLNGGNYSAAIPTASAVGTYTVDYKVLGDANHSDTASSQLTVSIAKNTVTNPTITLSSDTFRYNGSQQKPTITVYDDSGNVIPEREYTVTITGNNGNNMVDVDTYTITVTTADSSNYVISSSNTRTYKIVEAEQETISITGTKAQVFYGDTIQLGTSGGTGSETITWTVTANDGSTVNSRIGTTGLLTVKDVGGPFTVTVKRSAGGNYKDVSATWEFSAAKKQVTAVVTADDRNFIDGDKSVTVYASVPDSELVPDDSITIKDVTGTFDDPNVGTNKRVTVDSTNASATGTNAGNYEITYPATTTASILAEAATVDTDPTPNNLTYDASQAQELVTAGTVTGGTMVYSLDGSNFTPAIPKAKDAGTYKVYFKAQGDGNHTDSAVGTKPVTIAQQTVRPQIELSPSSVQYDGNVKEPEVTVRDAANNVIPNGEYTVIYDSGTNWKDVGAHKVTVKNAAGGNYIIDETDKTFTISTTPQNPLEIVNKPGLVYYGDTFTLSAVGGSGSAAVTWSVDNASVVAIDANGFVKIIGTGSAKIKATKPGGTNYDAVEAEYPLNALKKPVTAIVTADDKVYDGTTTATIHVAWKDGGLVGNDTIDTSSLAGTFADEKVGTNKTVTITGTPASDTTSQKYDITIPAAATASILKADTAAPAVAANDRDYDGTARSLVTGGSANTVYSDARDGVYSTTVPTGTNAGTYTVWYKEKGDANHNDSAPQSVTVTISRKTLTLTPADITLSGNDLQDDGSGNYSYEYDGTEKKPTVTIVDGAAVIPASEYTVTYSGNKNVGTAAVTITSNAGGNYTFAEQTVKFAITRASAQLTSSPQAKDLTYTGQPQELVTVGVVSGGHIEYLQADGSYGRSIPAETNAGTYTVTYKVVGDGNYADSADTWTVSVTIKPKEIVSPKITVSGSYIYDGSEQKPADNAVTVEDSGTSIPDTEYTLSYRDNVSAGTATVVVSDNNGGNYTVNGAATFTIAKADVKASDITAPNGKTNLPYNGAAQELVTAGKASGGTMVYSLSQNGEYSPVIPAQTAVDTYTVWYKVQGDSNHNDTTPASVPASIIVNNVANPTVQVTPETVKYNGQKQEPTVTVRDDKDGHLIDGSEYTVTYADADGNPAANLTSVGKYTLTITGTNTHYTFTATAIFEILPADQTPLTITGTRERVYYGDTIQLGTTGGSGTVAWKVDDSSTAATIDDSGLLTITGVGSVTVTATSSAPGYADQTATWPLYADKKPVTAVVTAAAKTYDGVTPATTTVTAALQSSDLVNGDTVKITLSGSFEDPNAGTDKKVNIDSTNPNFAGSTGNYQNYSITYPATTTASILKADIAADTVTAPTAVDDLEYTGLAQALVEAGSVTGGILEYSLDNRTYSASLPTGTDAGGYDIWYRVKGDGNHNDTEGTKLSSQVTIAQQTVDAPIIEFTPSGASYDGAVHKPAVAVKDNNGRVIPDSEYTVTYSNTDWKQASTAAVKHEVTVADKAGGNYSISQKTAEFTISQMGQNPLSIVNQPGRVQYGDTFTLSTSGGSGTGAVTWDSTDKTVATISDNGLVKVLKSGAATITATKQADGNYGATTVEWSFSAEKKPVTAIVTADDKVYDGSDSATIHVAWKDGDLLNGDTINLTLTGTFNNANAGNNKPVTITGTVPNSDKYAITYNAAATASITPKAASVAGATATELTYDGSEQELVSNVTAANGTLAYSRDGSYYTLNVPKETNAGKYTIWYKAQAEADGNYKDSPAVRVDVTIKPKTVMSPEIVLSSETFDYDGTAKKPDVVVKDGNNVIHASEYTVSYSDNTAVGIAKVTISDNAGGNYTVGTQTAIFTIKAGAPALTAEPQPRNLTYNGREQTLVTRGTAVNGRVLYSLDEYDYYSTTIPKETNAGTYEVWYKVEGDDGTETDPESVIAEILPKLVTPVVTVNLASDPLPYTGSPQRPPVTVAVGSETLNEHVDYTITYSNNTNVGTATIAIQSINGSNYEFYTTRTFEIAKTKAAFAVEPKGKEDLRYTGEPQVLIVEKTGISLEGVVLYSRDTVTYSAVKPTETKVGSYTIFAKVQGDSTHEDSEVKIITATISRNTVNSPTVTLSASSFPYTGSEQKPTVTVADDEGNEISADEYTVTYSNNVNVGTARISIKSKAAGNYSFTAAAEFQIVDASQTPLAITGRKDDVYYGDTLSLGTTGGGSGAVTWSSSNMDVADIDSNGAVKIKASGSVTITAAKGSDTATWPFYAKAKPVTAVVTAADKPYDGNNTAALTVTISSGLLPGDSISTNTDNGVKATGHFTDASVGPNKIVVIDALTIPDSVSEKYDISCLATTSASITQAAARVTAAPAKAGSLTYNGSPQPLLTSGGTADGGNLAYSVDGGKSYSFDIPTGTDAGSYTVWYKVVAGDENHKDSAPVKLDSVTIAANTDTPTVLCTPGTFQYDGTEKTPTDVVVRDRAQRIIPESEYTVTLPANRVAVDTYTVTITDKPGGNYEFSGSVTGTFNIVAASQSLLSIITDKPTDVYYGDTFRLSAMGGSGSGAIVWSITGNTSAAKITSTSGNNCVVTVTGTEGFTVEAYRAATDSYSQSNTDYVPFVANPKPVTPVVTAEDKPYDGNKTAKLKATWKSGDLMNGDTINLDAVLTGTFDSATVGTNKRVTFTVPAGLSGKYGNYYITWPDSTTASIDKVDAKLKTAPAGLVLTYDGSEQALVSPGSTENNVGTVVYSLSQNGAYSENIPTAKNAGKYTVWYKVADSVNYTGVPAASVEAEIKKADPSITTSPTVSAGTAGDSLKDITFSNGGSASVGGKFAWKDDSIKPGVGESQQVVLFTPDDTANYNTVELQIPVTIQPAAGTDSTNSGSGADNASGSTSNTLAQGPDVVIKQDISSDATKAQFSIPVSTVNQIQSEPNAALTFSSPIADVTIPNAALDTLGRAGGTVDVVTEQMDQGVALTLTAGGEKVENIPGGVTLSVPAEDAGPGTVAVLVHDDGTRETIQKSVTKDGVMNIPLNGSATVEIVDNSKEFTDVPSTSWAADAVAFASAHELFSGTSETTFSPDQAMSRGMLTTVLYNLEGRPDQDLTMQDLTSGYSDVSSDAWYAEGVAWASENGIVSGYGDGQFNPDDSITREQFAVMLWRYAGSPQASGQALAFTDADQASGYAQEALCWAVEKGILNGYANGRLAPGGTATRAEAAQMLKNFMEST